jgi:hypothetical protein
MKKNIKSKVKVFVLMAIVSMLSFATFITILASEGIGSGRG